ncbi:MAG TPA: hypothetical protein VGI87_15210 [Solirubrobacteraceae bacterium]
MVSASRYALGFISLLIVVGGMGASAVTLRQRFFSTWTGALARLAEVLLGLSLLIALSELLGTVGLFRLGWLVAGSLAIVVVVGRSAATHARVRSECGRGLVDRAATAVGLTGAAAVTATWAAQTLASYDYGIRTFDSLWYHLPWAAWFAQTGHVTPLRFTDVEYLTPFYPATSELLHAVGLILLGRDTLSPGLNLIWLGLTFLAAYCVGRPRGLGGATALGAAIALGTPMMVFSQAGSAANDIVGIFFLLAAVAIVLNASYEREAMVLAALAAGFAIGTKLTLGAGAVALTVGVIATAPRGTRGRTALWWLVPFVLAGGFWYVRNLIAVGNPLPWVNLPGLAVPVAPLQVHTGFSIAHYAGSGHFWTSVVPHALLGGLGNWWPALVAGAIGGPLLCLLPGAGRTQRMVALVALVALVAYLVTPESAAGPAGNPLGFAFNLRYAGPALTLCLTVLPLAPVLDGARMRWATLVGLLVVLVATIAQARLWPPGYTLGAVLIGAVFLAFALASRFVRLPGKRAGVLAGATALAVALLAVAAGGYIGQRHYLRVRYAYQPGISSLAPTWDRFRRVRNARVGIVGTFGGFFSYPLFGLDDSNHVEYIAHHGAHGSFTPIASCREWRTAVNAADLEYLITTPARDPWNPRTLHPSPEGAWTRSDPAAHRIYSRTVTGQPIEVFQIRGPLNPARC